MNSSMTIRAPRRAERLLLEADAHRVVRFLEGAADHGALARGEPVGLDDEG
jgi:hypothetical protein